MNLEKLLNALYENPTNISIQYTNIDGKESLTINGKEYNTNNELLEKIDTFRQNIKILPSNVFEDAIEIIAESIDLSTFSDLLEKDFEVEELNEEEAQCIESHIKYINAVIKKVITEKAKELAELVNKF